VAISWGNTLKNILEVIYNSLQNILMGLVALSILQPIGFELENTGSFQYNQANL
jgi:hypothetical protein